MRCGKIGKRPACSDACHQLPVHEAFGVLAHRKPGSTRRFKRYAFMPLRTLALAVLILLPCAPAIAAPEGRPPFVPDNWSEESGKTSNSPVRFVSPDGTAWLVLTASLARGPFQIARRSGERITYQRVTPRFVAVAGYKGDRIFYRKSNLVCRGTRWHHIVMEYPAEDKRKLDAIVTRIAHGMNRYDRDCPASSST